MDREKRKSGGFQFLQFGIIGVGNALIDIGMLNLLLILFYTEDRMLLLGYNTISYLLAVSNSYFWNASVTFNRTSKGSGYQRIGFVVQALISLGISNIVFIGLNSFMEWLGVLNWLRYNIAKGLAMLLSSLASFFMVKYFVFKDYKKKKC
ncbi:Putative flippase GtrA (transmembrane translocase of bactoprenol-linked glucose) [Gracilibacillus ureilyticus]|uniref:Putative flippase GtrA (Transmembrane translocase of bactoprenol-linked glucose) n=1 Tax=Gracilibacillus ureilyticus TaxID=531814 RepID=A0A1H9QDE3_9BACI|nr:GtrA family protein [Gracilibacillus ureilyticus]SER57889.1 Putative flippase GtrA (transmembrane translocase of bactoprenol-linked glucose) [Gracilibacillus ureilyticus]